MMFENRVLRRIFGPKRVEVAEGWRRLHSEELHNLYASPILLGSENLKGRDCVEYLGIYG
jgi:hypothetical protein